MHPLISGVIYKFNSIITKFAT